MIAKLILDEMVEARRHVKNAPPVGKTFDVEQFPKILLENFPELVNTKPKIVNGLLSISNPSHPITSPIQTTTLLRQPREHRHHAPGFQVTGTLYFVGNTSTTTCMPQRATCTLGLFAASTSS
jgi:hypothetical protein